MIYLFYEHFPAFHTLNSFDENINYVHMNIQQINMKKSQKSVFLIWHLHDISPQQLCRAILILPAL